MGQRHQVFIRTINLDHKQNSTEFGNKKTTILAYHHQWLYGRSPLVAANNILSMLDAKQYSNPFLAEFYNKKNTQQDVVNKVTHILSIFNSDLSKIVGRNGYENFLYLNKDEPNMREDFTIGDNNDGVLIIDTIEKKYCFVNIDDQNKNHDSVRLLPSMVPCSAADYVKAYYPEEINYDSIDNENFEKDLEKKQYDSIENAKGNKAFIDQLKDYKILSLEELKIMFPKSFQIQPQEII